MQHPQPRRVAALYCRPTPADPACAAQRRALHAHVSEAGHTVHGVHEEAHPDADAARGAVLDLARAGRLDTVLVARLSHWSRSATDLLASVRALRAHGVALQPLAGPRPDLVPPLGERLLDALEALAEFERELRRERAHRGQALARAAGKPIGRQPGQCPKSDKLAALVLDLAAQGLSQRAIAARVGLNKNTVGAVLRRAEV